MSLNTAHADHGVLIHAGECILLFSDNVNVEFLGNDAPEFNGSKTGRMYLTTHRMIYNAKKQNDILKSFSFPFIALQDVGVEQPMFGANYIKGKVRAQPNGNYVGEVKFKLTFKSGGAIEFGQAMLKVAQMATQGLVPGAPPPYSPPQGPWYAAPPPAYQPPPAGYYGWSPPTHAFPDQPPPNSVFMSSAPPPYPGLVVPGSGNPNAGYPNAAAGGGSYPSAPGASAGYPGGPPAYPGAPQPGAFQGNQQGYPSPQGYPGQGNGFPGQAAGYPSPAAGFPGQAAGFPGQAAGYPGQAAGYPGQGAGYPGQAAGYPGQANGYPGGATQTGGYPGGFNPQGMSGQDAKAAEAAQSAYYDPNRPQTAFVPPPFYDQPPSYQQSQNKKEN